MFVFNFVLDFYVELIVVVVWLFESGFLLKENDWLKIIVEGSFFVGFVYGEEYYLDGLEDIFIIVELWGDMWYLNG